MNNIDSLGKELSHNIKTQEEMTDVLGQLLKSMMENILNAEMDYHLGYEKNEKAIQRRKNTRNGYSSKTLKTNYGEIAIQSPRDRDASFEPMLVAKGKTRLEGFEDTIVTLYTQGMTVRQIQETIKELYNGAEISTDAISRITEAVIDEVQSWQSRLLDAVYVIVYLDCIVVKVREQGRVINKSVYLALGINRDGHKELLGLWISDTESSKFWLSILTELRNRNVKDSFICCVDGLKGFAEAITMVFPKSKVQLCMVHMMRNSLRYVATKDKKEGQKCQLP